MLFHPVVGAIVYLAERRAQTIESSANTKPFHFFNTDDSLVYIPFCDDFGPMNLHTVNRFCDLLDQKLSDFPDHALVYCVDNMPRSVTNAAFLLGSYMVLKMRLSPEAVWSSFEDISGHLTTYRDATFEEADFHLTLVDCWCGLSRADSIGWVRSYDMEEYLHYDSPLEGDLHELIPGKIVAFRGPQSLPDGRMYLDENGSRTFAPGFYLDAFGDMGVSTVVRLNEADYDAAAFADHGVRLVDLQFDDCSAPPAGLVAAFMDVMRGAPGAVAVHCRAGLGRTGTLAAAYMMATHGFTAREAMGWLRIVRPGSVIGEQQQFLCELERARRGAAELAKAPSRPPAQNGCAGLEPVPEDAAVCFDTDPRGGGAAAEARRAAAARQVAAASGGGARVQAKLRERVAHGAGRGGAYGEPLVGGAA